MNMNVIEFNQVSKSFQYHKVLSDVTFSVAQNSVFGFLGNNGAGKSTVIKLMLGMLNPSHGEIRLFNQPVKQVLPAGFVNIGCIVDTPVLYENLTASEFLSFSQRLKNLPRKEIERVLEVVDLSAYKKQSISGYSLGMKQRLAIANTLLGSPKLLILDEPTNGLDPQGMQDMRELLKYLPERAGCTVFVSSHLLSEIERIASHIAVIHGGEIVKQDSLDNLKGTSGELRISCLALSKANVVLSNANFHCSSDQDGDLLVSKVTREECAQVHHLLSKNKVDFWQSSFCQQSLENVFMKVSQQKAAS